LDYATNRYYSSSLGRFLTPDPYSATATSPSDPSSPVSWNRYTYIDGDPANQSDPTGLDYEYGDGDCPASQPSCGGATQPPEGTPIISSFGAVTTTLNGAVVVIVAGAELTICLGSGVCEVISGIAAVGGSIYLGYELGTYLGSVIERRKRAHQDPTQVQSLPATVPGTKDSNGNCIPPPPDQKGPRV
jgi:RHS repeat-associated protein